MIDLSRFAKPTEAVAPIIDGTGRIHTRKIKTNVPDGWYLLSLGDKIGVIRAATTLEIDQAMRPYKPFRVYALGPEGVPLNFDQFFRKGLGETVRVHFLDLQPFELAYVVQWEDGRVYFKESSARFDRAMVTKAKEAFEKDEHMPTSGITPELRYYWVILSLQRQSFREAEELERLKLSEAERQKRIAEFQSTIAGRIQSTVEMAGGEMVSFVRQGNNYLVHWKTGNQIVKSTIRDDLRIMDAGFCLSGDDRRHTLASIVQLAKLFQNRAPLYITRE